VREPPGCKEPAEETTGANARTTGKAIEELDEPGELAAFEEAPTGEAAVEETTAGAEALADRFLTSSGFLSTSCRLTETCVVRGAGGAEPERRFRAGDRLAELPFVGPARTPTRAGAEVAAAIRFESLQLDTMRSVCGYRLRRRRAECQQKVA
jgi:hypothetical protein